MNVLNLEGIELALALTFGPLTDDGRVIFAIESAFRNDRSPGVYAVTSDEEIVYVGSYRKGVVRRWLYTDNPDVYHFKKPQVVSCLQASKTIKIYAASEVSIKKQLGQADNRWVNTSGIEGVLIKTLNPAWNKQGK
jgi:hypothetical protein